MTGRLLSRLRAGLSAAFGAGFGAFARVPSSLDMRDDTPVWVRLEDGRKVAGFFRGAAPDGSYAVRLEGEPGCLRAFDVVELR